VNNLQIIQERNFATFFIFFTFTPSIVRIVVIVVSVSSGLRLKDKG